MRWIRVDVDSPEHRKVSRLAEILEISPVTAFGLYVRFLAWCGRFCEFGDISKHTPYEIGRGAGALETGLQPSKVYDAFVETEVVIDTRVSGWITRQSSAYRDQATQKKRDQWKRVHNISRDNPGIIPDKNGTIPKKSGEILTTNKQTNNTNKQTNKKPSPSKRARKSVLSSRTTDNLDLWRETFNVPKRQNTKLRIRKMQALEKIYTDDEIENIFDNLKQSRFHMEGGHFDLDGRPLCNPDLCEKYLYAPPEPETKEETWRPIKF